MTGYHQACSCRRFCSSSITSASVAMHSAAGMVRRISMALACRPPPGDKACTRLVYNGSLDAIAVTDVRHDDEQARVGSSSCPTAAPRQNTARSTWRTDPFGSGLLLSRSSARRCLAFSGPSLSPKNAATRLNRSWRRLFRRSRLSRAEHSRPAVVVDTCVTLLDPR